MPRRSHCSTIAGFGLGLAACAADTPVRPVATIQDVMILRVNPAANLLWGSVALESTQSGTVERAPRGDAEWEAIRRGIIALMDAADLLATPGRRVAAPGAILADANTPGNLAAGDIQNGIDTDWLGFVQRARALRDAALGTLAAVEEGNIGKLAEAGETVNTACAACHDAYWYPNSIQPVQ